MFSQKMYMKFAEPDFNCVTAKIRKQRLYRQLTLVCLKNCFFTEKTIIMFDYFVKYVCISRMQMQKESTAM